MKRYLILLGLLLIMSTNVFAKETMKVGYLPILDHLPLVVSHERENELFKEVDVEPKMFKKWDELAGAIKAGAIDAAFILSPLAMDMFNSGVDIRVVLLGHRNGSAITVAKDSDIKSAKGLKDKKIGIPHAKATHTALLDKYLRGEGLSLKDVKTTVIAPPDMVKAMAGGNIDAFIVAEPWSAKAHLDGVGKTLALTRDILPDHVECVVIARSGFIKEHPAAMQEWVDSLIRAGKFIESDRHKNNSKNLVPIAKKYMGQDEAPVREALVNPYDRITFDNLEPDIPGFRKIVDISRQAGILDDVKLEGFIDSRFYKKSKAK